MFTPKMNGFTVQQLKTQLTELRASKFKAEREAIELGIAQHEVDKLIELGQTIGRIENELFHRGEKEI